jgi:hypothetical protein
VLCFMLKTKIVHLSPTPLVGAPGKIAHAQREIGHDSQCVIFNDYPKSGPLCGFFTSQSIVMDENTRDFVEGLLSEAEVIHIHNFIPESLEGWVRTNLGASKLVYHAHSPMREGPLYYDRSDQFDYDVKLVVGQHWGRLHPKHVSVPNLVLDAPSVSLRKSGQPLKVMYSPTHKHKGRWTSKHSAELVSSLEGLSKLGLIELIAPKVPIPPSALLQMRRKCHLTIDEISTGGFHQVSLEGLCTGNMVLNKADYFSKNNFSRFSEGCFPPFVYGSDSCIADVLLEYAQSVDKTNAAQMESYNYYLKYCDYRRLVKFYDEAYAMV